jgi:hypothetical protein
MIEARRREEYMPSPNQIKQWNTYWKEKIKNLRKIVQAFNEVIVKR